MTEWLDEWLPVACLFLATTAMVLVPLLWRRRRDRIDERLGRYEDDPLTPQPLLGSWQPVLADLLPLGSAARSDLERDLRSAGYYQPTALGNYLALRVILVIAPLLLAAVGALAAPAANMDGVVLAGLLSSGLGYSLPRVHLLVRGRMRSRQIERGLPMAIDLLILCLSAGQNLLAALGQVSRELAPCQPVLGQELAIASRQAELHSFGQAMKQWAERVNVPDVTNVALLLIQSERLGTDAAATLSELADNFRTTLRQRAEAQANRTSFWMLFPSVFCFWVAAAIILAGPPYVDFLQHRQRSAEIFDHSRDNIHRANERTKLQSASSRAPDR